MLYFAYGSNLWLQQMARRCPGSYLVGRGVLYDYRWQINERGYANVVRDAGCCVHGLVYSINNSDQVRLDRSEGVGSGAYSKAYCSVVLYPVASSLQKRPDHVLRSLEADRDAARLSEPQPRLYRDMLVYLSTNFVSPGLPDEEYIDRINFGIHDAIALGVRPDFFSNVVRPLVPPESGHSNLPRRTPRIQPELAGTSRIRRPTKQEGQSSSTRGSDRADLATDYQYQARSPSAVLSNRRYSHHKGGEIMEVIDVDEKMGRGKPRDDHNPRI